MKGDYHNFYDRDNDNSGFATPKFRKCQICRIGEKDEPLMQFGDYVYLCTLCNTNKAKNGGNWSFNDAWKQRYALKEHKETNLNHVCAYCGNKDVLRDIFAKEHPNPIKLYDGRLECEYCRYDRKIATPRHNALLLRPHGACCIIPYHL